VLITKTYLFVNFGTHVYKKKRGYSQAGCSTELNKAFRKRMTDTIWNADQQGKLRLHKIVDDKVDTVFTTDLYGKRLTKWRMPHYVGCTVKSEYKFKLGSKADISRDRNDCAIRSMQYALDLPWKKVYDMAEKLGRKKGKGTDMAITDQITKEYATLEYLDLPLLLDGKPNTVKNIYELLSPQKTYYIRTWGHIFTVRNGVCYGNVCDATMAKKRVYDLCEITKN
jgi:hypothetical protein